MRSQMNERNCFIHILHQSIQFINSCSQLQFTEIITLISVLCDYKNPPKAAKMSVLNSVPIQNNPIGKFKCIHDV